MSDDVARAEEILDALVAKGTTTLDTDLFVLRHVARRRGWSGTLRGPITYDQSPARPFLDEVRALLPAEVTVELAPHRSLLKKAWASAVSGIAGMTRIRAAMGHGPALTLALPDRDDLLPEAVALTLDTAFALYRRFGEAATYVDSVSFDHAEHGMAEGRVGGAAPHQRGQLHLNANYAVASTVRGLKQQHLEGTVAHEFWHKIEMGWESVDYAATVEFRRAVGGLFGKPTIEQVFNDDVARERLIESVSAYAATNRMEATAELFKLFWSFRPEDNLTVEAFGEIVDRFLPSPG